MYAQLVKHLHGLAIFKKRLFSGKWFTASCFVYFNIIVSLDFGALYVIIIILPTYTIFTCTLVPFK